MTSRGNKNAFKKSSTLQSAEKFTETSAYKRDKIYQRYSLLMTIPCNGLSSEQSFLYPLGPWFAKGL